MVENLISGSTTTISSRLANRAGSISSVINMLTTQYEAFRSLPGEGVTAVFERLNKLLNEMSLHGKKYGQEEINIKFMLT